MKANITSEKAGLLGLIAAFSKRAWRVEANGKGVFLYG